MTRPQPKPEGTMDTDDDHFGLRIAYEPETIHLNIVFVHGLNGNQEKTWQYSTSFESFWPNWLHEKNEETVLRRNLENARIVTFGYDAGWKNITATSNVLDLTKFADGLLSSLLLLMNEQVPVRRPFRECFNLTRNRSYS